MEIIVINATWCLSCLYMKPTYLKVEQNYKEIIWKYYDIDLDEEAKKYETNDKLPVLILVKDNKEIARLIGEKKEEEIKNFINEYKGVV